MNPLTLLPLLAAAVMAAPGAHVVYQQPALAYAQVPLTQTVHYAAQPVVTGYSTTVVKPALAAPVAPIAVQGTPYLSYYGRQLPGLEPPSDFPIAPPNNTMPPADLPQPAPPADLPPIPGAPGMGGSGNSSDMGGGSPIPGVPMTPPIPGQPGMGDNGNSSSDMGGGSQIPIPGSPILGTPSLLPIYNQAHLQFAPLALNSDAVVLQARSLPVAAVRAAQAGDFEPIVTKEKVLAPVRTHTQITPQYTQIQPEVTVRKIVHDVPVATPVAYSTPYLQQIVA